MGFVNPILGGGGALVRPAIKSPNYAAGSSGWQVARDGSAEFNDLSLRGVFTGTDYVLNTAGLFQYDGVPALGNLVSSVAPTSGTDEFGNHYVAGVTVYDPAGSRFAQLDGGTLALGFIGVDGVPDTADAAALIQDGVSLTLASLPDSSIGLPNTLLVDLSSGAASVSGPGNGEPVLKVLAAGSTPASIHLSGAVIATKDDGTEETWHTPAYTTGWSGSTTMGTLSMMPPLHYRRDGEDRVLVEGLFTAASGAGTAVFQFPLGYRPAVNSAPIDVTIRSSAGAVTKGSMIVSTAGNLDVNANLGTAVTAGSVYAISGSFPLGNVA